MLRISVTTTKRLRASGLMASSCRCCASEAGGAVPAYVERLLAAMTGDVRDVICEHQAIPEGKQR